MPASACRLRSCRVTAGWVRWSCLAAAVTERCRCTAASARSCRMVRFPRKAASHARRLYKKNFGSTKDIEISLILQIALPLIAARCHRRAAAASGPAKRAMTGETAMDERPTLRSHLGGGSADADTAPRLGCGDRGDRRGGDRTSAR